MEEQKKFLAAEEKIFMQYKIHRRRRDSSSG